MITVEDGTVNGGMGSAVLEWMAEYAATRAGESPVTLPQLTRLGVPDRFIPQGTPEQLHHLCGFDCKGIYEAITRATGHKKQEAVSSK